LIGIINNYKSKGLKSIAIVTKNNDIARELFKQFEQINYDISLIDDNIDFYDNRECIVSSYNSKGLEFDGVIVYNVSDIYESELDRNLLYIALTRALHKLTITYFDKPSELIKNIEEII
jgi:DNA helicase-2/ATP-dependent DNA helicase PcrA